MKDAQKPDHVSLNTLVNYLREGRYVIPDFQREFEWKPWDIRELMRSIFMDYYIGSLLLWKGKEDNFDSLSCESIYAHPGDGRPEYIVLDGQQRLTAMYYAFFAPEKPLPNRKNRCSYFIHVDKFMSEQYDEAFGYEWLTRRWARLLNNRELLFENHIFPCSVIGEEGWALAQWAQDYEAHWKAKAEAAEESGDEENARLANDHAENAKRFSEILQGITGQYQISFIELDKDIEVSKVCDIFTQINSKGIRLDAFDLINALLKPKGLQLKNMFREASTRLDKVEIKKMNVYILQVMSILKQRYCSPKYLYFMLPGQEKQVRDPDGTRRKEILINDPAEFEALWNKSVDSIEDSINVLLHPQEYGGNPKYLPYLSIIPAFAALRAHVKSLPANQKLDANRKLRHWYWAAVFTNRYSGSVESTAARDFSDVKVWIEDDDDEPALIGEFANTYRNIEFRKERQRGGSIYNGIFNLLVLKGARDWMSGDVPRHNDLDDHHIIPNAWCKENLKGKRGNTILNRSPLTVETNRSVIRDRLPNEYLPELIEENGEQQVRSILESHFISPVAFDILMRKPFGPDDFDEFIGERQRTLLSAIDELLIKQRLDLPANLRELDLQIEKIELGLRELVDKTLDGQLDALPTHVTDKVKGRISSAIKKNPALDPDEFQKLAKQLEYFDLREIQDVIVARQTWPKFKELFKAKPALETKFGQLAELRNGIRHSRSVTTVVQKEGEAAIEWFQQILKRTAVEQV